MHTLVYIHAFYTHICPSMAAYIHIYIYADIQYIHTIHIIILYQLSKKPTGFIVEV